MARLLVCYAHPAEHRSAVNRPMAQAARGVAGITLVDLYGAYPRQDIDIAAEQARLLSADILVLQYPLFWYATPALLKDWIDLVLEYGFAYGQGGDRLAGKTLMLAISAGGQADAYGAQGFQRYPLRTFLTPMEQTARLCQMRFAPPYVLFGALSAPGGAALRAHVAGYRRLLEALRDETFDFEAAKRFEVLTAETLPIRGAA